MLNESHKIQERKVYKENQPSIYHPMHARIHPMTELSSTGGKQKWN